MWVLYHVSPCHKLFRRLIPSFVGRAARSKFRSMQVVSGKAARSCTASRSCGGQHVATLFKTYREEPHQSSNALQLIQLQKFVAAALFQASMSLQFGLGCLSSSCTHSGG